MTTEEQLKQQFGNSRHFTVPEGYFDNFTATMMERLEEEQEQATVVTLNAHKHPRRPMWLAAACIVGAVLALGTWLNRQGTDPTTTEQPVALASTVTEPTNDEMEEAMDYYMIDEQDLYAMLTEN